MQYQKYNMQITSDEWINIGKNICRSNEKNWNIEKILQHHYGKTHNVNKKIVSNDNYLTQLRVTLDNIIQSYYPHNIYLIPNTDISITETFYNLGDNLQPNNDIYGHICNYQKNKCIHKYKKNLSNEQKIFISNQCNDIISYLDDISLFINNKSLIFNDLIPFYNSRKNEVKRYINTIKNNINDVQNYLNL